MASGGAKTKTPLDPFHDCVNKKCLDFKCLLNTTLSKQLEVLIVSCSDQKLHKKTSQNKNSRLCRIYICCADIFMGTSSFRFLAELKKSHC